MDARSSAAVAALIVVLTAAAGCAIQRERNSLCDGVLQRGIRAQAFLDVWGPPTRTKIVQGTEKVWEANWGGGGGSFYGGTTSAEVWVYEERKVEVMFSGKKKQLVAWNTDKTVAQLKMDCSSKSFYGSRTEF